MRFAFADPPYIGQARKHYRCPEVDHLALIRRLVVDYPDGWALSCSSPTLFAIGDLIQRAAYEHFSGLAISHSVEINCKVADCYRDDCRIGAWVKPYASFKPGVNPAYAWEPVVWHGGRQSRSRDENTARDWLAANIMLKKGLAGAKPPKFCDWVFDLLGATDEDELDDLFPGTGVVTARWKARQGNLTLT